MSPATPARVALATGGNRGIGFAICRQLASLGYAVLLARRGWVRTDVGGAGASLSPDEGADTPIWLATLPDGGPTGGFFQSRRAIAW